MTMAGAERTLTGKVVAVTGASAGVGRAVARALARQGALVGLIARDPRRLEAARSEVTALGSRAVAVPADVARAEEVESAADRIEDELGDIDVWVNCAMATVIGRFSDVDASEFQRVTEVTYLGNVNGTRTALARMIPRKRGCIVQVGSALAYQGIPLQAAYCGAKHAIKGYTESLCSELIASGSPIRVTMVELPAVNTPQFDWARNKMPRRARPVAPVFQPELAAEAIVWAATAGRREVLVGGSTWMTIWGNRLAPGLMARLLARMAISGQQTEQPEDPDRPDNLWQTVPGETGARGRFGAEASDWSAQWWATRHRPWLATAALALVAGTAVGILATRQSRHDAEPDGFRALRRPDRSWNGPRALRRRRKDRRGKPVFAPLSRWKE